MDSDRALEITELTDTPPNEDNYKFILLQNGAVFWVAPFEAAGGRRWGEVWEAYEDSPTHSEVTMHLGLDESTFRGAGYCTDGDIMVYTDDPIDNYADQIRAWWPHVEFIEWDGEEIEMEPTTAKLAAGEPIATIARVSHSAWPPSGSVNGTGLFESRGFDPVSGEEVLVINLRGENVYVPPESAVLCEIYPQFAGGNFDEIAMIVVGGRDSYVWSSDYDSGNGFLPSHQEVCEVLLGIQGTGIYSITTAVLKFDAVFKVFAGDIDYTPENAEMLLGLLQGAQVSKFEWNGDDVTPNHITASIRERVLSRGLTAMGYLGCFWCRKPVEKTGTIVTSRFYPDREDEDTLVPSCLNCRR